MRWWFLSAVFWGLLLAGCGAEEKDPFAGEAKPDFTVGEIQKDKDPD